MKIDEIKLDSFINNTSSELFKNYNSKNCILGELSSSALATAVAAFALSKHNREKHQTHIAKALKWLDENINNDGSYGDSPESIGNLSTSILVYSFIHNEKDFKNKIKLKNWLAQSIGELTPDNIKKNIVNFYREDKTFSAPILMMCCVAGLFENHKEPWALIPQLPFEFACLPHSFYKILNLKVVSYALPALISVGLCKFKNAKGIKNPLKVLSEKTVLNKLAFIQPDNGGFLEATPLTGFVAICLTSSGYKESQIVNKSINFLLASMRNDGSWPIDTNLSTWVSSLAIKASTSAQRESASIKKEDLVNFYFDQQLKEIHRYTNADPGGWAWTNLAGAVPDGDDTAAALIVLSKLSAPDKLMIDSAKNGITWLLSLQNKDGGIPTFCKGWGKLPFDRSCPDISAHALEAIIAWESLGVSDQKIQLAKIHIIKYLNHSQHESGYWVPLWFGNQYTPNQTNPIYGTSQVLRVLNQIEKPIFPKEKLDKAVDWLSNQQNSDGSFGHTQNASGSIEETSLALLALCNKENVNKPWFKKGYLWLINKTESGTIFKAEPIGLYFASLWYSEKQYPISFCLHFLNQLKKQLN
jgi:prenyltransferase beta subunit